jgi:release factor glutamine methyltransferase
MIPRWVFRRFWLPIYRWWALRQTRGTRQIGMAGLKLEVPVGVFHPGLYFSTPIFLDYLRGVDFNRKNVLDVGCGSGVLGLFAAQRGAQVLALDINPLAVACALQNARENSLEAHYEAVESDLFEAVAVDFKADVVLINPPYYPKDAQNYAENAFFAGGNLEYFERLFGGLRAICQTQALILLILSEDCPWEGVQSIARRHGYDPQVLWERVRWGERFWVVRA